MKRLISGVCLIILMIVISAGLAKTVGAESDSGKISVITTVFPPYDFIKEISDGLVEVRLLLPPGSESHSYEPTPQDIIAIQNCDVFVCVGGESEKWVNRLLDAVDTDSFTTVSLMDCTESLTEETADGTPEELAFHEEHEGHEDEMYDEHVWTSPKNAELIVRRLRDALCAADGINADIYAANAEEYINKLEELNTRFMDVMEGAKRNTVVFGDRFPFRYLADEYGITYYSAYPGCSAESEAGAATVASLIDKVRDENIPVVFHIEMSNEKLTDTICEATGAKKLLLHSCHNVTIEDLENDVSYLELMTQNVENLKEALW